MATGDILPREPGAFGLIGTRRYQTHSGATAINPGEPVLATLGSQYVSAMATNMPNVSTDFLTGLAQSQDTVTASADGFVDVWPLVPGVIYTIKPKVVATFGLTSGSENQSTYNALVGDRVLIDLTSGSYTLLAVDGAGFGCVIENQNVFKASGRVAFSFRNAVSYTA